MKDELDRARRTLISHRPLLPRSALAAVAVGAAFGMGMLVGGMGEARGASPAPDDALAVARARADALERKRSEIKLAFPVELLAPEARGGARAVPAAPRAEKPPTEQPQTEQPQTEQPQTAQPQTAQPQAAQPQATEREAEPAPAIANSEDAERPSIQATLAKVLGGAPPTATPAPAKARTFALQVASLPQRAGAEALTAKLAGQGLNARVVVGEVGGREVFRVRVGSFAVRDQAEAAKSKLAMPSFIVGE